MFTSRPVIRSIILSSLLLYMTLLLLSCSNGQQPASDTPDKQKVVVVGSQWYGHIPVWLGIE